ncbi:MAG: citrate transporter [Bacteroidota bacterium]
MNVIAFIVFVLTLVSIAIFHKRSLECALAGLFVLVVLKYFGGDFSIWSHLIGHDGHEGEWRILLNLLGLLTGFEVLSKHFTDSGVPQHLPLFLPDDWKGGFVLLAIVFVLSSFLDNIAAAMIGGAVASVVFKGKVHIGFIVAIVAAANAGGSGSVIGDTTTTMMWISGIPPLKIVGAYLAAFSSFFCFAIIAARQQDKHQVILKDELENFPVDKTRLLIVILMLAGTVSANILFDFPALGLWVMLVISSFLRKIPVAVIRQSLRGTFFLMALVLAASLLPVSDLPAPTTGSTFLLGILSSVFDNIPLTKLAIESGGYDWSMLAYAVGFGGSMIWFGSSAGVAISNIFPESRSVFLWVKSGWHVIISYGIGFWLQHLILGWHP